jgi:ABC-type uncharacterized transport system substrate-binding protein
MNREQFCRAILRARILDVQIFRRRYVLPQHAEVAPAASAKRAWRPSTFWLVRLLVMGCIGLITTGAEAHPHVWVTMKTVLVYAPDGSVAAVQHAWTFDDMFSAFAAQGVHARTTGQFTRSELQPLAQVNVDSLKEYAFFTYAKIDGRSQKDSFGDPTNYWLDYDPKVSVLTLPFKNLTKAKQFTVEIYDPDFFIDFGFGDPDPVRLVGAPPQCKPTDDFFSSTLKFDKSLMTSEANVGMGMNFANKITVTCP